MFLLLLLLVVVVVVLLSSIVLVVVLFVVVTYQLNNAERFEFNVLISDICTYDVTMIHTRIHTNRLLSHTHAYNMVKELILI